MKKIKILNVLCITLLLSTSLSSCSFFNDLNSTSNTSSNLNTSSDLSTSQSTSQELTPTININESSPISLKINESYVLDIIVENYDGNILVESSNTNIVRVIKTSSSFILRGVSYGTCQIRAKINDEIYDSIEVSVSDLELSYIKLSSSSEIGMAGDVISLNLSIDIESYLDKIKIEIIEGENLAHIIDNNLYLDKGGTIKIQAYYEDIKSNIVEISIYDFECIILDNEIQVGDNTKANLSNFNGSISNCELIIKDDSIISYQISNGEILISGLNEGNTTFYVLSSDGLFSNEVSISVIGGNPYLNIDKDLFYKNYKKATSLLDATYRSDCYLMSGSITPQDQQPDIATNQPSINGKLVHNTSRNYSDNGKTYTVYNVNGQKEFDIYYGGAYTSLEEVAAYIYAWGEIPVNYDPDKYASPYYSEWGEYLRVNDSTFSGDSNKYPYEPELPNISGLGGDVIYHEIDIGTTGTDCDPNYEVKEYNDGYEITRGAARIVYTYSYSNGYPISDEDRYVFYTYNHYNDFQEYLNYYNGWGEMFGNITGGGVISSKDPSKCNPTPYVETYRVDYFN